MNMMRAGKNETANVSIVNGIGCSRGYVKSCIRMENAAAITRENVITRITVALMSSLELIPNSV